VRSILLIASCIHHRFTRRLPGTKTFVAITMKYAAEGGVWSKKYATTTMVHSAAGDVQQSILAMCVMLFAPSSSIGHASQTSCENLGHLPSKGSI
jgi:hypothetical protein